MNEIKKKALDKMLIEIKGNKQKAVDQIHNWLCEQEDDELFKNVLKENKNLDAAFTYCSNRARKVAISGVACVDDSTVFGWVVDYYANEDSGVKKIKKVKGPKVVKAPKKEKAVKKVDDEWAKEKEQLSLLDFI